MKRVTVEALLSYWIWQFILPSSSENSINGYVFPLAIHLAKGKKLPLGLLHIGSLYGRLDKYANNILRLIRLYDVITYANTSFLYMFLREGKKAATPRKRN